ncbi:MAG: ABC transporter permease [Bacilli bacterium]|nr:ABC transporter permease [Bacilli bacterium]
MFKNKIKYLLSSLFCVEIALAISFLVMLALSFSFEKTISEFAVFISGGSFYYTLLGTIKKVLTLSAPMLCCSMAIILPFKTGIFNIGVTNQFIFASLGTIIFALKFKCHYLICILAGSIFGILIALIPVLLKVYFSVNEIISGILLNYITLNFVNYIYKIFLMDLVNVGDGFKTYRIPNVLPGAIAGSNFSYAFILAILISLLVYLFLEKTTYGFSVKASGTNYAAATYVGINVEKNMILTMVIAGALAGIGSSIYYLSGIEEWCIISQSLPQFTSNSIVVAFFSQMNPIGAIFSAFLISLLRPGSAVMSQSLFPKEIGNMAIAIIIYIMLFNSKIIGFFNDDSEANNKFIKTKVSQKINKSE